MSKEPKSVRSKGAADRLARNLGCGCLIALFAIPALIALASALIVLVMEG